MNFGHIEAAQGAAYLCFGFMAGVLIDKFPRFAFVSNQKVTNSEQTHFVRQVIIKIGALYGLGILAWAFYVFNSSDDQKKLPKVEKYHWCSLWTQLYGFYGRSFPPMESLAQYDTF